ncbi:MAG: hemerythrin domain-containing protein [Thermoanaerobaculia bacterium]
MRATELLEKDHARIDELFAELDRSGGESAKNVKRIFGEIMQEIELHSDLVERFLHPVLAGSTREPLLAESEAAQEETAALLRQIGNLEPGEEAFVRRMADLRSRFRNHAEAERTRLVPFVKSRMSDKQLEDLGTLIEAHKAHRNSGPKE